MTRSEQLLISAVSLQARSFMLDGSLKKVRLIYLLYALNFR